MDHLENLQTEIDILRDALKRERELNERLVQCLDHIRHALHDLQMDEMFSKQTSWLRIS